MYIEDLRTLYRRAGRNLLVSEEEAIMRRLDQDGDGKLSFSEFYDAVNPSRPHLKSPDRSYAYKRTSPSPSLRLRNYSPPLARAKPLLSTSTAAHMSLYESPPRRSYFDSPARGSRDLSSGNANIQPKEYSPLRGFQATR